MKSPAMMMKQYCLGEALHEAVVEVLLRRAEQAVAEDDRRARQRLGLTHFGIIAANCASRRPCIFGRPACVAAMIESSFSPSVRKSGDLNVPR